MCEGANQNNPQTPWILPVWDRALGVLKFLDLLLILAFAQISLPPPPSKN